jgi:hypothetical protein
VVKASRATLVEAIREAEFELSGGAAFAWIVDGEGHLILPADQVKARLRPVGRRPARFRSLIGSQLQRPPSAGRRLADRRAVSRPTIWCASIALTLVEPLIPTPII